MSRPRCVLHTGEIVLLSGGEYSSYSVAGAFIVAKSFHWREAREDYCRAARAKGEYDSYYGFAPWLIEQGYVVELDTTEWHYDY